MRMCCTFCQAISFVLVAPAGVRFRKLKSSSFILSVSLTQSIFALRLLFMFALPTSLPRDLTLNLSRTHQWLRRLLLDLVLSWNVYVTDRVSEGSYLMVVTWGPRLVLGLDFRMLLTYGCYRRSHLVRMLQRLLETLVSGPHQKFDDRRLSVSHLPSCFQALRHPLQGALQRWHFLKCFLL